MAGVKVVNFPAAVPIGTDILPFIDDPGSTAVDSKATFDELRAFTMPWFIRANVDRTLPNDANLNAIFNAPTNGRFTLATGVYHFQSLLLITSMSATSGNALLNVRGAGTATISDWMNRVIGLDAAAATPAAEVGAVYQVEATGASAVTAQTNTNLRVFWHGMFNCTTGGTLIPSIDQVTAAAAVVEEGSFFMLQRLGAVDATSFGPVD